MSRTLISFPLDKFQGQRVQRAACVEKTVTLAARIAARFIKNRVTVGSPLGIKTCESTLTMAATVTLLLERQIWPVSGPAKEPQRPRAEISPPLCRGPGQEPPF